MYHRIVGGRTKYCSQILINFTGRQDKYCSQILINFTGRQDKILFSNLDKCYGIHLGASEFKFAFGPLKKGYTKTA